MKIAVKNLSVWLHCFFSQLQPWQRHTLMTAKQSTWARSRSPRLTLIVMRHKRRLRSTLHG